MEKVETPVKCKYEKSCVHLWFVRPTVPPEHYSLKLMNETTDNKFLIPMVSLF